jgi:hypothetical protein
LTDSRGKNAQLPLADLLRQSVAAEFRFSKTLRLFSRCQIRVRPSEGNNTRSIAKIPAAASLSFIHNSAITIHHFF